MLALPAIAAGAPAFRQRILINRKEPQIDGQPQGVLRLGTGFTPCISSYTNIETNIDE